MNLEFLFEMQRELDSNILWKHPELKEQDLLPKKVLAAQVELGELANEWRGFKFWSTDQKPRSMMLEEFVDVLHFVLSIGIELGYQTNAVSLFEKEPPKDINEHFIALNLGLGIIAFKKNVNKWHYEEILISTLQLGIELGYTPEEIKQAYIDKNGINIVRQSEGY